MHKLNTSGCLLQLKKHELGDDRHNSRTVVACAQRGVATHRKYLHVDALTSSTSTSTYCKRWALKSTRSEKATYRFFWGDDNRLTLLLLPLVNSYLMHYPSKLQNSRVTISTTVPCNLKKIFFFFFFFFKSNGKYTLAVGCETCY